MTIFWIMAAGLAGLGVLFVVVPLVAKREAGPEVDQDVLNLELFRQQLMELDADLEAGKLGKTQYKAARRDLERELLYDVDGAPRAETREGAGERGVRSPLTAALVGLAVPVFAFALYLAIGDRTIIPRLEMAAVAPGGGVPGHPGTGGGQPLPSMDALVERLAAKMEENPDDLEGWLMLGRSYFAVNQPEKALHALERAYALGADDPAVLLAYAQAVAANANGRLAGQPQELIARALELDPENVTGRWMSGLLVYQAGDFEGAVKRWEALLEELDPASEEALELREFVAEARQRSRQSADAVSEGVEASEATAGPGPAGTAPPGVDESGEGARLTVKVSLAEPLWTQAEVDHTLFVYAKAVSGPPMPLAVKRLRTGDLPATVTLDDSMAMVPAMRLSAFPEVTVGARISASGQAAPASGDLEGEAGPVKPGVSAPVEVVIDRVRP